MIIYICNLFLGTREKLVQNFLDEETKTQTTQIAYGKYKYMTYGQVYAYSNGLAKSIIHSGLCPQKNIDGRKLRILGLFSRNREEWALTDIACVLSNIVSVPLYETLGENSIEYVINQTEMDVIALGADKVEKICSFKKAGTLPTLTKVIWFDKVTEQLKSMCESAELKIFNILELAEAGQELDVKLDNPTAEDIFTIWYTSGTTGNPKGVISTHRNFVWMVCGIHLLIIS